MTEKQRLLISLVLMAAVAIIAFFLGLSLFFRDSELGGEGKIRVPPFDLPVVGAAGGQKAQMASYSDLPKPPYLINIWATWCAPCRVEHPYLMALSGQIDIVGVQYLDENEAGAKWLAELGNPYALSLADEEGNLGFDLGVIGVPETMLIGAGGEVELRHRGLLNASVWQEKFTPLLEAKNRAETPGAGAKRSGAAPGKANGSPALAAGAVRQRPGAAKPKGSGLQGRDPGQAPSAAVGKPAGDPPGGFKGDLYGLGSEADRRRFWRLAGELRCLSCQGQSLAGSNSPIAASMRLEIASLIKAGATDGEILTAFHQRYGDFVLASPKLASAPIAWVLPALIILAVLVGGAALEKRRRQLAKRADRQTA